MNNFDEDGDDGNDVNVMDIHKHGKLIADVQTLGNEAKSKYKHQRSEAAPKQSEFGLPSTGGRLSLEELVSNSSKLGLKKVLKRIEKKKRQPSSAIEPSLLKPEEEKQTRVVAYEKVKEDLHKWDNIVWENRIAPTLHFPLEKPNCRVPSLKEFAEEFTPATSLENEVMALLNEGRDTLSQFKAGKTRSEEIQMRKRALEEIRHRRAELIKQRMKVAYEAQKNKHRNKIKSKRFHQLLRREKIAIQKKAEENASPEEAAEILADKLADLERKRIEERASLRHKPGGTKFGEKQKIIARFDSSARQAVDNMVAISKTLTQKRIESDKAIDNDMLIPSSEEETEHDSASKNVGEADKSNPWFFASSLAPKKTSKNVEDKKDGGKQYTKLSGISASLEANLLRDDAEFHGGQVIIDANDGSPSEEHGPLRQKHVEEVIGDTGSHQAILTPALISEAPHNPDNQRLDVAAAFAEDDVVAEFMSEKEKLANKEQPKDVNLSLPGWGGWTGPGVSQKAEQRKRERFTLKAKRIDRKDAHIPHVIIKEAPEKANEAITQHQPKSVPFPFTSTRDFERSIRQPVGREWVPEVSRRELIKPRIETQIGAIIQPLDADGKKLKKKLEEVQKTVEEKKNSSKSKRAQLRKQHGKGKKKPKKGASNKGKVNS